MAQRTGGADSLCVCARRVWSHPCAGASAARALCVLVCVFWHLTVSGAGLVGLTVCVRLQTLSVSVCLSGLPAPRQASGSAPVNSSWGKCQWPQSTPTPHPRRSPPDPAASAWAMYRVDGASHLRGDMALRGPLPSSPRGPQWPGGMWNVCTGRPPQPPRPSGFRLRLGLGSQVSL